MDTFVNSKFKFFLSKINPTTSELEKSDVRVSRIVNRIKSDFDTRRVFIAGSHWKKTAVKWYSDIDIFVVMAKEEAKKWAPDFNSFTLMKRLRNSVHGTFPNNLVRVDRQAVVARFNQGDYLIDAVPAIFESFDKQRKAPIYLIPSGNGKWIRTCPDHQKSVLEENHRTSGNKLKSLVRAMKWWASCREVTASLSSLYIENLIMACQISLDQTYLESMTEIFGILKKHKLPAIKDPIGLSGYFQPLKRTSQLDAALVTVEACYNRARKALEYESKGNDRNADALWKSIFNGNGY